MTPAEGARALIRSRARVEAAELELENAKAERKELEETILPPIFLQAGLASVDLPNGARATKSQFAWARLARPGDPKRQRLLSWLEEVGEQDAIKMKLTAEWSRGNYDEARQAIAASTKLYPNARVMTDEDVHWKQLERIVLEKVKGGLAVPLSEINATFGDHVTITRNPIDPLQ